MQKQTESLFQSGQLLQLLAYVYLENHRAQKAVVLLQAVDALGLADTRALALLALAHRRSDQPDLALQALDRIPPEAAKGSLGAVVQLIRAQALHALGRADDAYAAMQAYMGLRTSQSDSDHRETF